MYSEASIIILGGILAGRKGIVIAMGLVVFSHCLGMHGRPWL